MGKKKHAKSFIKCGDKTICIDDLVESVNKYDKTYGIRLKHPDVWANPIQYLKITEAKAEQNIAALICLVNGVAVKDYVEFNDLDDYEDASELMHIDFTEESLLDWNNQKTTYNDNSMIFRCRFITLVLMSMLGKVDKIIELEVNNKKKFYLHSRDEQKILITKKLIEDCVRFVNVVSNTSISHQNIILRMHEHTSYTKKKVKHQSLRNLLNGHVLNTRHSMNIDPITKRFAEDDMTIYNVLKISFMLATNSTDLKAIPNFKYIEHATVKHDLGKLIEELGREILIYSKGRKYGPMFKAYVDARPRVYTQFHKECNDNFAFRVGVLALKYTNFVCNDKTIKRFINEMLKKGI